MDERKEIIDRIMTAYADMEFSVLLNIIESFLEEKTTEELYQYAHDDGIEC